VHINEIPHIINKLRCFIPAGREKYFVYLATEMAQC